MNKTLFSPLKHIHYCRTAFIPQHIRYLLQGFALISKRAHKFEALSIGVLNCQQIVINKTYPRCYFYEIRAIFVALFIYSCIALDMGYAVLNLENIFYYG